MVVNVYIEPVIEIETKKRGEYYMFKANSYTTNFIKLLYIALTANTCPQIPLTKTDGSPHSVNPCTYTGFNPYLPDKLDGLAPATNASYGILVGTDTSPFDFSQYSLGSPLPASILRPYDMLYAGITGSGNISTITFSRVFENVYGTVTVAETGYASWFADGIILSLRDVLPSPITLAKGDAVNVRYKLSFQA